MRIWTVTLAASLSLALGCGGNEVIDGAGGVGGTGASGGAGGAFEPTPGCRSNAECADQPSGTTCFEFGAEGPSTCGYLHVPVTRCEVEIPGDECCSNDECEGARCFLVTKPNSPCGTSGGGDGRNECVADECERDADCPAGLCTPDGYANGRICLPAACETNADCSEKEGGVCTLLDLGCCGEMSGGAPARAPETACAYPGDGCQSDADCQEGEFCVVREGRAVCSSSCP